MKKFIIIFAALLLYLVPKSAYAAGIYASGGGSKNVGQTFTVTIAASGAAFDSLQGVINVSGPVDVMSVSPGGATWMPGKSPAIGSQFVGITSGTDKLTVATVKLKAKSEGSGSISVSGAKLAKAGAIVGTDGGSTSFSIQKAPELPGKVSVSSSSHPDQNASYEERNISLSWSKSNGATGFSYLLDQSADTVPAAKVTSADTSATYNDKGPGTYYFHIRAQNGDGWGGTTHFKINIKEPEPKEDASLKKPYNIEIKKGPNFVNDIDNGTVSDVVISGMVEAGYFVDLTFDPGISVPEGKKITGIEPKDGKWDVAIDYPIKSGFYKLTARGKKDKTLTPVSDVVRFEISQAKGGTISLLTSSDTKVAKSEVKGEADSQSAANKAVPNQRFSLTVILGVVAVLVVIIVTVVYILRRERKVIRKV